MFILKSQSIGLHIFEDDKTGYVITINDMDWISWDCYDKDNNLIMSAPSFDELKSKFEERGMTLEKSDFFK